ncbi:hypothetical protein LX69_02265 [Breznakibacter xylanolyticus]|uniref:Metallopeptidase DUF4344 n=1 Tax=Breznakibacter xylanolyticus TaxID=990 RepID=A0A2W7NAQ9_9BACT|nr:hypothetical protein [Breznakibacter xylanolyticus]MBN2743623.1 hypothetical protein [Marinilabiliaceae bacterium]PZX15177.1 hypothetical protein LX69_02265 [Breznakibacter xylanolyticus]
MKRLKRSFLLMIACLVSGMVQAQIKVKHEPTGNSPSQLREGNLIYTMIDSMAQVLNCRIEVREARIKTTLNARPALWSLLGKKEKRKYIIRINNNPKFKGIRLDEVPLMAGIGLWAHELMHVKDYHHRTLWGVMERGWQYLSQEGKRQFEHEIDRMAIEHGFGQHLYAWSYYVLEESNASPSYKAYKQSVYLTPSAIRQAIEQSELPPHSTN